MLSIKQSGTPAAALAAEARKVPVRLIPYAASTALTRVAQFAQRRIVEQLPVVFDRPTRYTLNATRIVPSTVATLSARVAVKDRTAGRPQESYLLPEVEGGVRREKAFERALRYAGVMHRGEVAMPAAGAPLDAAGNLSAAFVRRILAVVSGRAAGRRRRSAPIFAGTVRGQRGVWSREGRRLRPLLIFTTAVPSYRSRLDFEGIVRAAAEERFAEEFARAIAAIR